MQGTIRLVGVSQQRHTGSWLGDRSNNFFQDHVIQSLFNLVPVFYGDLPPGMLHWGNRRVHPDGIGTGNITYGMKRVWKGSFQDHNVPYLSYIVRGSHRGWLHLRVAENGLGNAGKGAFVRVGCLIFLEAGELGTWGTCKVLESMELPTLTSWLLLMVLNGWKSMPFHPGGKWSSSCHGSWLSFCCVCGTPLSCWLGPERSLSWQSSSCHWGGFGITTWSMEWVAA